MKRKKIIVCLMIFILCFSLSTTIAFAQLRHSVYQDVGELVFWITEPAPLPIPITFKQTLSFDYNINGSWISILHHYNDGLQYQYSGYMFDWYVTPNNFKWYENYSLAYNFTSFIHDYTVIHHPSDRFWGGRNSTPISFYLPGNIHSAEIVSSYFSLSTIPSFFISTLTYGPN